MSKTLSNFLVGVGFDLDKKSMGGVASGIDGIKSKALQLGAVVGGAFGIKALTNDFASAKDQLGKFSEVFGVQADDVQAFGNALRLEGGTLEGFMSQLAGIEKFRAGLAVGDAGFISAAGIAGLDVNALVAAEDATEGFLELADQFQGLSQQQRLNAASALGLDESAIRLLSKGRDNIEQVADAQRKMRPITKEMTDAARDFNDEFQDLSTNVGGVADKISTALLPQINKVVAGTNDWFDANRGLINSGLDTFLDSLGENAVAIGAALTAITVGTTAAAGGGALAATGTKLGLESVTKFGTSVGKFGGFVGKFGAVGLAAAGGYAAGAAIYENLDESTADAIGGTLTHILADFGLESAKQTLRQIERSERIMNAVPIAIENKVIIDGQVIDKRINNTVGEMADMAITDLKSTEGG